MTEEPLEEVACCAVKRNQEDTLDACDALVTFIGRHGDILSDTDEGDFQRLVGVVATCRQEKTVSAH